MDDILYALMEEALRRMEPTIVSFEKEVEILINLAHGLSHHERSDFVRRAFWAKENMSFFSQQLEIKDEFLKDLLMLNFVSSKLEVLIRFL